MRRIFLGKNHLHWCDTCGVPVLGALCACGSPTRSVDVTPPGDIRPAFTYDVNLINSIYSDAFGAPLIPKGHLALLNKTPSDDRMEEIIMGGAVIGGIRYYPDEKRWKPVLRPSSTAYLSPKKRYVKVDKGAIDSITNAGASVLAPGLSGIDDEVRRGDEVYILDNEDTCIAVGRARVDAEEARGMERGVVVRTKKAKKVEVRPHPSSWEKAVEANRVILQRSEDEAVRFVQKVLETNSLPANVSYSGGKDSLATLLVVLKAAGPLPLIFADTGMEFLETLKNVSDVAEKYRLELNVADGAEAFRETMEKEGPPAVNKRWCCKVGKLIPVKKMIEEKWGECISFIGQRKYESFARMKSPRVWRNNNVTCQLSAAPIQHWTALHVWLYLFSKEAPYNSLYEEGIDRIGCFMCPSSDLSVLFRIRSQYPDLWCKWDEEVEKWRISHGIDREWTEKCLWRKREEESVEDDSYS